MSRFIVRAKGRKCKDVVNNVRSVFGPTTNQGCNLETLVLFLFLTRKSWHFPDFEKR